MKMGSTAALCATAFVTMFGGVMLATARSADRQESATLRIIADAVTIDARCRDVSVDFGALFRYGESKDIAPVAIMPLGPLRTAFEAALDQAARTTPQTLCTSVVAHEQDLVPGMIRTR